MARRQLPAVSVATARAVHPSSRSGRNGLHRHITLPQLSGRGAEVSSEMLRCITPREQLVYIELEYLCSIQSEDLCAIVVGQMLHLALYRFGRMGP